MGNWILCGQVPLGAAVQKWLLQESGNHQSLLLRMFIPFPPKNLQTPQWGYTSLRLLFCRQVPCWSCKSDTEVWGCGSECPRQSHSPPGAAPLFLCPVPPSLALLMLLMPQTALLVSSNTAEWQCGANVTVLMLSATGSGPVLTLPATECWKCALRHIYNTQSRW